MKDEEKGAIPSEAIENEVSHSLIHPVAAGTGLSEEKEVEDLARAMCTYSKDSLCRECSDACFYKDYAKRAIDKGWRKQSEGEWHFYSDYFSGKQVTGWTCGNCNKYSTGILNYCPYCGAKMKGGAE